MSGTELCKRCKKKGITREALPGKLYCQYCRFVKWKVSEKRVIKYKSHASNWNDLGNLSSIDHPWRLLDAQEGGGGRKHKLDGDEAELLKLMMTAKSRFSSEEAEANQLAAYAKKPFVWKNSIVRKFDSELKRQQHQHSQQSKDCSLVEREKLSRKFRKHDRFKKLVKGFPIRRIRSHQHYLETLKRALEVDPRSRAANYAYLELLDVELAKYEQQYPEACTRIWVRFCNESAALADMDKTV